MSNNRRLKLIVKALRLSRANIARACVIGGEEVSNTRADSWLRNPDAIKNATGNARGGSPKARSNEMSDAEFDAFCLGLDALLTELDRDE